MTALHSAVRAAVAATRAPAFEEYHATFLRALLQDTAGFAGCEMIRCVLGIAHMADLESIANARVRAQAETQLLQMAELLVLQRHTVTTIQQLIDLVCSISASVE